METYQGSEVRALRERCGVLEEENLQLRELLAPKVGFPAEWKLTASEAKVLTCIYSAPKNERGQDAIREAVSPNTSGDKLIHVYICKLRKKLAPFGISIHTMWGSGYKLDKASVAIIAAALKAERIAA